MESIEKLRKYAANFGGPDWDEVGLIADAIEDEIDEKYVMRPTGLDGLLIYEGDVLETVYGERTEVTDVMATVWSYGVRISPSNHRHVTDNDPVKGLLEEFGSKVAMKGHQAGLDMHDLVDEYAPVIREAASTGKGAADEGR